MTTFGKITKAISLLRHGIVVYRDTHKDAIYYNSNNLACNVDVARKFMRTKNFSHIELSEIKRAFFSSMRSFSNNSVYHPRFTLSKEQILSGNDISEMQEVSLSFRFDRGSEKGGVHDGSYKETITDLLNKAFMENVKDNFDMVVNGMISDHLNYLQNSGMEDMKKTVHDAYSIFLDKNQEAIYNEIEKYSIFDMDCKVKSITEIVQSIILDCEFMDQFNILSSQYKIQAKESGISFNIAPCHERIAMKSA